MSVPSRVAGTGAASWRRCHALHARGNGDFGYSVLEAAITVPLIFFLLMAIVQWAVVWHARSVADAAAQEGLRSAEAYQSTAASGQDAAQNFLAQTAPHALRGATVTVTRSGTTVTVHVHAPVMAVIPFGNYSVDSTVSGPIERYVESP